LRPNYFDGIAKYGLVAPVIAAGGDVTKIFSCQKRFAAAVLAGCSVGVIVNMAMGAGGSDWGIKKQVAENEFAHNVVETTRHQLYRSTMKRVDVVRSTENI